MIFADAFGVFLPVSSEVGRQLDSLFDESLVTIFARDPFDDELTQAVSDEATIDYLSIVSMKYAEIGFKL